MGIQNKTPTEIFSRAVIAVSLACLSGLGLGHSTEQTMRARLSANPPADPVERYALGQNAYKTSNAAIKMAPAPTPEYTDASYEIGRYEDGTRILAPEEPARKIDRLRLERLQAWNEQNFGGGGGVDNEVSEYAQRDDYAPIDVGAVMAAPESAAQPAVQQIAMNSSGV